MKIIPQVFIANRTAWRAWLKKHHTQQSGIWLVYVKGSARKLAYDDIVEEALCYGWIDSTAGTVNATHSKIYVAPRKAKSNWSRRNKQIIARLEKAKLMQPAGQVMVALAKKTGTWTALDEVENLVVPSDLANALQRSKNAQQYFEAFPRSAKRAILEWILNAKKPETRAKRIAETVQLAKTNLRATQVKFPKS